jgi:hypothetical protein
MLKDDLQAEINFLSQMEVDEYTLYNKWLELREFYKKNEWIADYYNKLDQVSNAFHSEKRSFSDYLRLCIPDVDSIYHDLDLSQAEVDYINPIKFSVVKDRIWIPNSPNDYLSLKPELILADDKELLEYWQILSKFCSSFAKNKNPGRFLPFLVIDKGTESYLGIICISNDYMDLKSRDDWIGWNRDTKNRMLRHTAVGSTIVPTQPLGGNYRGGKLIALLAASNVVEECWNNFYKDKLVGITTTSLYGSLSQYKGINCWKKMKHTSGSVPIEPTKPMQKRCREWLKETNPEKYKELLGDGLKHDQKNRFLYYVYKQLGITNTGTTYERGVFFCPLYEKTREFLRNETKDLGNKIFDNSVESLTRLWKEKYAPKGLKSAIEKNKFSRNILFYDKVLFNDWETVKSLYLKDVGR